LAKKLHRRLVMSPQIKIFTRTGSFGELSGPLTSNGSLCCGVHSKKDHSIVNGSMQQKGLFNP